ncbi:hypothetical protein [Streptomyces cyaneofuscatus]|uniref:hypothetical protein n=1 Tax=Streptomyces cyaneofuscatus TaxID=66883 RepID=UPI0033A0AC7E
MSKSTLDSIRSAVTHSGPSYRVASNSPTSLERSTFLNALTHSGPSYEIGMTRKLSPAEAELILTDEIAPLIKSLRPLLEKIKAEVLRLDRNEPEASRKHLAAMQRLLGEMIELIELDYIEMTNRLRRSIHPFAVVEHFRIWNQRRSMLQISRLSRELHELGSEAALELRHKGINSPTVVTMFDRLNVVTNLLTV